MYNMANQVAVVTAGTMGIGRAIVDLLLNQGANVAVCARDEGRLEELGTSFPDKVFTQNADLQDPSNISTFIRLTAARFGTVHSLFYNAPNPPKNRLLDLTQEDWDKSYHGIVTSLNEASRLLVPMFKKNGGGVIVVISSLVAVEPMENLAASSVIRAGLAAWVKLMARDHGKDNIRVNAVLPGYTMTPLLERSAQDEADSRGVTRDAVFDAWKSAIPLQRFAQPQEIAHAALFLASAYASYVTGAVLLVDGGAVRGI